MRIGSLKTGCNPGAVWCRRRDRQRTSIQSYLATLVLVLVVAPYSATADTTGDIAEALVPHVESFVLGAPVVTCAAISLDMNLVIERCGDDDGCEVRLVGSGAKRASARFTFTIDSSGEAWTANLEGVPIFEGSTVSGAVAGIIQARRSDGQVACELVSDISSTSSGTVDLLNCYDDAGEGDSGGQHTCVARFDD